MIQYLPFADVKALATNDAFERSAYQRGQWAGAAGLRSRFAQGLRHRQHAHADPCGAGQRSQGPQRNAFAGTDQVMTLATHEFIRRFLIHVLPAGFHRIRYYGLLASPSRAANIARARELLAMPLLNQPQTAQHPCPCCGSPMVIIERIRTRGNSALPTEPANPTDQDRHIMIMRQ
jgi:hypothetical protein